MTICVMEQGGGGWKGLETAAQGERENISGVVEHREVGLIPRVVVFRCKREPIGEGPANRGSEEHNVIATLRCAVD